jgi:hypothetical protein
MDLGDLLDELRHGILHDASDQVSGAIDYLWSDKRLTRYIDEAHKRFARYSLCLRDATTPEVCQVQLVALQKTYDLHPSIVAVLSACHAGDTSDLARAGHTAFSTYYRPDNYFFDTSFLASLPPGRVRAYSTDESISRDTGGTLKRITLRVYPEPEPVEATVLNLRVVRLPLQTLSIAPYSWVKDIPASGPEYNSTLGVIPEVPDEHHMEMLDWAAHLALRIIDHDAEDQNRSQLFAQSFQAKVDDARKLAMRKMFNPSLWGFGRNGWSYERG